MGARAASLPVRGEGGNGKTGQRPASCSVAGRIRCEGELGNMSGRKFRELLKREMPTRETPAVIRQGAKRKASLVAAKPVRKMNGGNGEAVN